MFEPNLNLKSSLCRTCLTTLSQSDAYNIYTTPDLANKLRLCSALSVESADEYPDNVCSKCYKQIARFYKFQQMCSKSVLNFHKLLETCKVSREPCSGSTIKLENPGGDPTKECLDLSNPAKGISIDTLENPRKKGTIRRKKKLECQSKTPEQEIDIKWPAHAIAKEIVDSSPLNAGIENEVKSEINIKVENVAAEDELVDEEFCGNIKTEEIQEYVHVKDENISADEREDFCVDEQFCDSFETEEATDCSLSKNPAEQSDGKMGKNGTSKNKENCKRWRTKLKEDEIKLQINRIKNKERMRNARKKWKELAEGKKEMIEEKRRKDRIRKRRSREKLAGMRNVIT